MHFHVSHRHRSYLIAVLATLLALILSLWIDSLVTQIVVTWFYLAVAVSGWYGGLWPGLLSLVLSVFSLNHFLIHHKQLPLWQDPESLVRLATFSFTAIVMLLLTENLRTSRDQLRTSRDQLCTSRDQLCTSRDQSVGLHQQVTNDFAALQVSEWRWRTLFDNVQMSVVGIGLLGQIEYMNPYFLQITGYESNQIIGRDIIEMLFRSQDEPQIRSDFRALIAQGSSYNYECTILTKKGVELSTAWHSTIMRNPAGQIVGIMSIGEDITQRQALEKTKNEFISVVSHELRTPLTGIRGSLGLLAAGIYDQKPEKRSRMLKVACEQSDRLVRLINDMLDLERLESGQANISKQVCAVEQLLQDSFETMRSQADQAQIVLIINPTQLQVWAAPDAIIQTLTNLLSNAIKFSPPQSAIEMSAQLVGAEVVFSIQDQGRGIPADKLEVIFDRFQQVDSSDARQKGGTGLGLAICHQIIHQHDGHIWVKSEIDRGSTFYFTLPVFPTHDLQKSLSH
jgi:PAS domain S-box-containing protein